MLVLHAYFTVSLGKRVLCLAKLRDWQKPHAHSVFVQQHAAVKSGQPAGELCSTFQGKTSSYHMWSHAVVPDKWWCNTSRSKPWQKRPALSGPKTLREGRPRAKSRGVITERAEARMVSITTSSRHINTQGCM